MTMGISCLPLDTTDGGDAGGDIPTGECCCSTFLRLAMALGGLPDVDPNGRVFLAFLMAGSETESGKSSSRAVLTICVFVGVSLKNLSCSDIFSAQWFLVQVLVLDTSASHNSMSTPISWSAAVARIVPVKSWTSQW